MENEKKPSRLGVRLSVVFVAVLLLVCMAVPAFAYSVTPPEDSNQPFVIDIPEGYPYYIGWRYVYNGTVQYRVLAFTNLSNSNPYIKQNGNEYQIFISSSNKPAIHANFDSSGNIATDWQTFNAGYALPALNQFWGNAVLYNEDGTVFYSPPKPDLMDSVGSGLTVVLDWVGSVVSAVVTGPMSGLLILLAVPVAITLLLVAFIVIRRIIWGA